MNGRTEPDNFVCEGDGISTLVVEGDWTAISIAGLSGHVLSPSNLSFSSDFGNLGRIDSAGALAILTLAPNAAFTADLPANLADLFALVGSAMVDRDVRSEEHTSELQSLMRIPYAVFCLKTKKQ